MRALGMPGTGLPTWRYFRPARVRTGARLARVTEAGDSSAMLERPKSEEIGGHRYCMRHICTYESA